nr:Ig-like domain-containing protein [Peribacillus glennii]
MKKSGYQFENWYEDENFDTVWDHLTGDVTIYAKWMDVTPPPLFINQVSDKSTTISGTTEKNAKVTLYLNEKKQKEIIADSKGNFTFTINKQKAGVKVKVIAKDDAGNTTEKITTVLDKTAPIISVNQISDQSISVTGTAQVMSTVKLYFGDKWQKITTTNEKGAYTFKISKQKAGVKVKVTATDKAGNTSTKLTTVLDRTAQEQPTVYTVRTTSKIVSGKTEKNATAG